MARTKVSTGKQLKWSKTHARYVYWSSPGTAVLSLLFAIALALAHHFFYQYWDQRPVANTTQQQWIIRVGTAFAFLVNAFMVVPISYAYTQQTWHSLGQRPAKVSDIDSLFSVLGNIFELFSFKVWFVRPLLTLTAIIVWVIPLASVSPPGTLSVDLTRQSNNQGLKIAAFNYSNVRNFSTTFSSDAGGDPQLTSPSSELSRLSLASLSSSTTFQQNSPSPNCSYTMTIFAPALDCRGSSQLLTNLTDAINAAGSSAAVQTDSALFFSWVPSSNNNLTELVSTANSADYEGLDRSSDASSQIYLYTNGPDIMESVSTTTTPAMINCSLHNASYTLHFNFSNTQQTLTVLTRDLLGGIAGSSLRDTNFYAITNGSTVVQDEYIAYLSIMMAFGDILTGNIFGMQNHLTGKTTHTFKTLVLSTGLGQISLPGSEGLTWSNETFANYTEQMFQNMTFSLLSSPSFTTDPIVSELQPATVVTPQNVYVYKPAGLLISYGVAIIVGILLTVIGVFTVMRNNWLSYDRNFSTFMRTTRDPQITTAVPVLDMNGAEPGDNIVKQDLVLIHRSVASDGGWTGLVPTTTFGGTATVTDDDQDDVETEEGDNHDSSIPESMVRLRSLHAYQPTYSRVQDRQPEESVLESGE